jgi:hypothetical protein
VLHRFELLRWFEVGVPSGHVDRLVSHQVLHVSDTNARHDKPTRKCVAKMCHVKSRIPASAMASSNQWRLPRNKSCPSWFRKTKWLVAIFGNKVYLITILVQIGGRASL